MASKLSLCLFCSLLLFLTLALAPPEIRAVDDQQKSSGANIRKRKLGTENEDDQTETTPTTAETSSSSSDDGTTSATATCAPCEAEMEAANGFGAGAIFFSILFGMGLMFALSQLYTYWENRRLGDGPNYRAY